MSIDARVQTVIINEDGSGKLKLIDRPAPRGQSPGCAGQAALRFRSAPEEVTALKGLDIWGGSSQIMLGDVEIARRDGYAGVTFCDAETFRHAVGEHHRRTRRGA